MTASTTRAKVRQKFADRFAALSEIELPVVAAEIRDEIVADPELLDAYVRETLYPMVYEEGLAILGRHRVHVSHQRALAAAIGVDPTAPKGLKPLSLAEHVDRARVGQRRRLRWLHHTEHVGDRHIKLLALTREQIPLARAVRLGRRDHEDRYIRLLDALEHRLKPGQVIGEALTVEQLDELYERTAVPAPGPAEALPVAAVAR